MDDFQTAVREQMDELSALELESSSRLQKITVAQDRFEVDLKAAAQTQATTNAQLATIAAALSAQQAQWATTIARLDAIADELKLTRARLDAAAMKLDGPESGLNVLSAKLAASTAQGDELVRSVKADRLDFATFRGKAESVFGIARWVAATAFVALITIILSAFAVARSAGSLEATVQQQQKTLDEIKQEIVVLRTKQ